MTHRALGPRLFYKVSAPRLTQPIQTLATSSVTPAAEGRSVSSSWLSKHEQLVPGWEKINKEKMQLTSLLKMKKNLNNAECYWGNSTVAGVVQITWLCREEMISCTESWCWETWVAGWWVQVCWKFLKTWKLEQQYLRKCNFTSLQPFPLCRLAIRWNYSRCPRRRACCHRVDASMQSWNRDTTLDRCEGTGHYFSRMRAMSPNFMVAMDRTVVITERIPAFWPQHCSDDAIELVLQGCKPGCVRELCHLKIGWQLLSEARTIQLARVPKTW